MLSWLVSAAHILSRFQIACTDIESLRYPSEVGLIADALACGRRRTRSVRPCLLGRNGVAIGSLNHPEVRKSKTGQGES